MKARRIIRRSQPPAQDFVSPLNPDPALSRSTVFLACADLHLRDDTPVCRMDDYRLAQVEKFGFLCRWADKLKVPIVIAGDVFNHWKPSHELVAMVIALSKNLKVIAVPGQHDLPQHNLDLLHKSGLGVLREAGWEVLTDGEVFTIGVAVKERISMKSEERKMVGRFMVRGYAFGEEPPKNMEADVLLWHKMTYVGKAPFPGCNAPCCSALAKQFPKVKLIITGDNHQSFVYQHPNGPTILNPGSMTRMDTTQVNFRPRFYAVDDRLEYNPIYFSIKQGVISNTHLEKEKERNEKLEAFVNRISDDMEVGLSFSENMTRFFDTDRTAKPVREMILSAMEGGEQ